MSDDASGIRIERRSPEDTFALLGSELRVEILRALAEAPETPVSFSALRERVGERDSGKFNYHLGKLTGVFVRRVAAGDGTEANHGLESDDGAEGYELTMAGSQLVGALFAGTYTAEAELDPVAMADPCPNCGERALVAEYADEYAKLHCTACEEWTNSFSFPPGAVDQFEPDALPEAFDRWMRSLFQTVVAGFCSTCGGRMDGELRVTPEGKEPARLHYACTQCIEEANCSPRTPALYHAGMVGFFYDHGVNVPETPTWRLVNATDEFEQRLVSEEPPEVVVEVAFGDNRASVRVDATGDVVAFERNDR